MSKNFLQFCPKSAYKKQAEKNERNIVQVLAHMNGFVFSQTERKRKEIEDFGDYFLSNGLEEEYSRDERIKYFGEEDAYILNIYYKLFEEEERKRIQEAIQDISLECRYEAMTLTDEIFHIKENKTVTLSTLDGPIAFNYNQDSKKHTEILKQGFFNYVAYAIKLGKAGIVVRILKKPKSLLLGIKIEDEKWRPLPVYEFLEDYEDGLDLSVMYTEITRKYA